MGLSALSLARELEGAVDYLARRLAMVEQSFKVALEVLSMRGQYFGYFNEHFVE